MQILNCYQSLISLEILPFHRHEHQNISIAELNCQAGNANDEYWYCSCKVHVLQSNRVI